LRSRHTSLAAPATWVTVTRQSFLDELVEEVFASFHDPWHRRS
jgi:hypothetical protein